MRTTATVLASTAGLALFAQAGAENDRLEIRLPSFVTAASCVVRNAEALVSERHGLMQTFRCPSPNERVICDFQGAEPIDLPLDEVCRQASLPIEPAATTAVDGLGGSPLTVEWLRFAPRVRGRVVATRQFTHADSLQLTVADLDERFLRLTRPGDSPVTISAKALRTSRGAWVFPSRAPGGELVARVEVADVMPHRYLLRRSTESESELGPVDGVLEARGLPPGDYRLTPVYAGGIQAPAIRVPIADGRSTGFFIPKADVGRVKASADDQVCAAATSLSISLVSQRTTDVGATINRSQRARVDLTTGCHQTVEGLPPGLYEVAYSAGTRVLASAQTRIEAQATASVSLTIAPVRVFGRVLVNGRPGAFVTVAFEGERAAVQTPVETAVTDGNGFYDSNLASPGTYLVSLRRGATALLSGDKTLVLSSGDNPVDWSLETVSFRMQVEGWDQVAPLSVAVNRVSLTEPGLVGINLRVTPGDAMPVAVDGLSPSRYRIEVRENYESGTGAGDKVGTALVDLEGGSNENSVIVRLGASDRWLTLLDKGGRPVSGAAVLVGDRENLKERAPGRYSLANVMPGTHLTIFARASLRHAVSQVSPVARWWPR